MSHRHLYLQRSLRNVIVKMYKTHWTKNCVIYEIEMLLEYNKTFSSTLRVHVLTSVDESLSVGLYNNITKSWFVSCLSV